MLADLESAGGAREAGIARRARALRSIVLVDCLHGEVVGRRSIPRSLVDRYGLENLYVEEFPSFWRLLYTVVKHIGRKYVVVVAIVDHRDYDRLFRVRAR